MVAVRKFREKMGISQKELSRQSGVSQQTIAAIETGEKPNPTINTVVSLARVFGCKVDDLIQTN